MTSIGPTPMADPGEPTNENRAAWAAYALGGFAAIVGQPTEPLQTNLTDLLADLRHLADHYEIDWSTALLAAMQHYHEETSVLAPELHIGRIPEKCPRCEGPVSAMHVAFRSLVRYRVKMTTPSLDAASTTVLSGRIADLEEADELPSLFCELCDWEWQLLDGWDDEVEYE